MAAASIALNRFGLGARPGDTAPADPRRWLEAQFAAYEARPAALASIPSRREVSAKLADYLEELRSVINPNGGPVRRPARRPAMQPTMAEDPNDELAGLPQQLRAYIRQDARQTYLSLVAARANSALATNTPFVERLVHFWSNHFAISIDKLTVIALGGMLELEAIRPNILGKFSDLLLAVEQHPAMLLYLDQAQSIGPNSPALERARRFGRTPRAGLNENLAREILELHTLGVDGGYGQGDVTELARAMTGWTVSGLARGRAARFIGLNAEPGDYQFVPMVHEPGPRTILGRTYNQDGEAQARAVLADLAAHPKTAHHLTTKLARHFAGDNPPPALVDRMTAAYLSSGGDLPTVYRVLLAAEEAWAPQPLKFKTPWDWSVSALRAIGARDLEGQIVAGLMNQLGQPIWRPGSPAGWDDVASAWAGPDALLRRVEAAERMAGRTANMIDARRLAPALLPGALTPATAQAIERAESPAQGLALLLVAPEFLRR